MVFYGYARDWARTLGPRISRVHMKDFKLDRRKGTFEWVNLGEGDVDYEKDLASHRRRRAARSGGVGTSSCELSLEPWAPNSSAFRRCPRARFE